MNSYFDREEFFDGTGRGKCSMKINVGIIEPNREIPTAPSTSTVLVESNKNKKKAKNYRNYPVVVVDDVSLPLPKSLEHPTVNFIPCAQFPSIYISPTSLDVLHWTKYHGRNISFYMKEIGYFSTADRSDRQRCREDFRYLKRLIFDIDQMPTMNIEFDLNIGSAYLNPQEPSPSMDALLWWIDQHQQEVLNERGKFVFDFVAWRGTIRKIMSSMFSNDIDWRIGVIRYRDAYFLHVFHTETELNIEEKQSPLEKRMCYWGHKFEDYLSCETPPVFPSPKKLFSAVNLSTLGAHTLLYGSEIDACTHDSILEGSNGISLAKNSSSLKCLAKKKRHYVEIKVVYAENMLELQTSTARKYAKWWSQCYLTGIERILLGFRDDYGIVRQMKILSIKDIETRARTWSTSSLLAFLNEFCNFVRKTVTNNFSEDDQRVHLFYFSPVEKKIKWKTSEEKKYQFLPEWFMASMKCSSI